MRIPCNEEDVQLLGEQALLCFHNIHILWKKKEIVEIKNEEFSLHKKRRGEQLM
jgi:hypothetical protein